MLAKCPLCLSNAKPIFEARYASDPAVSGMQIKQEIRAWIFHCPDCNLRFSYPTVPEATLIECYTNGQNHGMKANPNRSRERRFQQIERLLEKHSTGKRILDIGCSDGEFLASISPNWQKHGIEMAAQARQAAANKGVNILGSTLNDLEHTPLLFDAIVSLNVIEHISNPMEFLATIKKHLVPGGVLLFETGDYGSLFSRLMSASWCYYHVPDHVSFFNHQSIAEQLKHNGFGQTTVISARSHRVPLTFKGYVRLSLGLLKSIMFRITDVFHRRNRSIPWFLWRDHMLVVTKNDIAKS